MRESLFVLCFMLAICNCGDCQLTCANDGSSFDSWLCGLNAWMESIKEWKQNIEQVCSEDDLGTEWEELFTCSEPITVSCCNETKEHCEMNDLNCTICYCTDGKYTNRQKYRELHKRHQIDFQKALQLYHDKWRFCRRTACEETVASTTEATNSTRVQQPTTATDPNEVPTQATSEATVHATTMITANPTTAQNIRYGKENCSGSGGVTRIYPEIYQDIGGALVYCDNLTDGGGWVVFQRRQDGSVNFSRNWVDYVNGFGDLTGEFWMGLEKLHRLTSDGNYEIRIDLGDWEGNRTYAKYSTFAVSNSSDNFTLRIDGYSGTAGDSMTALWGNGSYHDDQQFSTPDRKNDIDPGRHCAQVWPGGWWFRHCFYAHLNGVYEDQTNGLVGHGEGIIWYHWKGWYYSLKFTEMKFRRKQEY